MIEKHIDEIGGAIPSYLAQAIGCQECPAIKAGNQCKLNTSRGPMPGKHDPEKDIPQFIKLMCSGTVGDGYRPCMQGFNVPISAIYEAGSDGVKPFTLKSE